MRVAAHRHWPYLLLAAAFCPTASISAAHIELNIERVAQQREFLCWAAVSQMAVNHLSATVPNVTQGQLAAYRLLNKSTPQEIAFANNNSLFTESVESCRVIPTKLCNRRDEPLLLGLSFRSTHSGPLERKELLSQLSADKPVLLKWHFGGDVASELAGHHYLIVIGIDTDADELLIWDPWPAELNPSVDEDRSEWITYQEYRTLDFAMGAQVTHASEILDLKRIPSAPVNLAAKTNIAPASVRRAPPIGRRRIEVLPVRSMSFDEAIEASAGVAKSAEALQRDPSTRGTPVEVGARSVGPGLPIVAVSPADLMPGRIDLRAMLRQVTNAVLYPVIADDRVVDAYLAVLGPRGWEERGYASTEVTRRLTEQRSQIGGDSDDVYVLAVPAWGTFFLGQGFGSGARLTPIATTSFSDAGRTLPALTILERMAIELHASETPDPADRPPVR